MIWMILNDPPIELLSLLALNKIMSQYFPIVAMVFLMRFLLLEWGVVCIKHFRPLSCCLDTYNTRCLYQLDLIHTLTRHLAGSSLMTLTVVQAILDQFLESDCRFSIRIIINDVWGVLDKTFLKDPIILSFKHFLDLQPVQSFQILSFIQETPQEYLGCRVNT